MNKLQQKLVELGYVEYSSGTYGVGVFIATYSKKIFKNFSIMITIVDDKLYKKELCLPLMSKVFGENLKRLTDTINILNQDWEVLKNVKS